MGVCLLGLSPPWSITVHIIYVHWGLWGQILPTLLSWRFPGDLVEHCFVVSVEVFQENSLWVTDLITKICPQHRQTEALDRGPERRKAEAVDARLFPTCGLRKAGPPTFGLCCWKCTLPESSRCWHQTELQNLLLWDLIWARLLAPLAH